MMNNSIKSNMKKRIVNFIICYLLIVLAFGVVAQGQSASSGKKKPAWKVQRLLSYGVAFNDLKRVKKAIADGADIHRTTPLIGAVSNRSYEIAKYLIDMGVDVNKQSSMENYAIHEAVRLRDKRMIKLLIQAGANLELLKRNKDTPLKIAIRRGSNDIIDLLVELGADISRESLHSVGNLNTARHLIKKYRFDVNQKVNGETPLHHAIDLALMAADGEDLVEYYLQKGANPNTKQPNGAKKCCWETIYPPNSTPLQMVRYRTQVDKNLESLLIKYGAK